MEFHDRGLPLPTYFQSDDARSLVPCYRDGAPDRDLPGDRGCHPGLYAAEGSNAHTDPLAWWSKARVTGMIMPAFLLDSGFVGQRLIPYLEEPCRALHDFDTMVMPHQRRQEEARQVGRPGSDFVARGWIGQEIEHIREGFDCVGGGHPRPEWRDEWMATTFRLHLYDASGKIGSMLDISPGWAIPRRAGPADSRKAENTMRWLPAQFPRAARQADEPR